MSEKAARQAVPCWANTPDNVWLYGTHVALLREPTRFRYRLDFTEDALDILGEGSRVL